MDGSLDPVPRVRHLLCIPSALSSPLAMTAPSKALGVAVPWGGLRWATGASTPLSAISTRALNVQAQAGRQPMTAR
jgi:hypothetical protein